MYCLLLFILFIIFLSLSSFINKIYGSILRDFAILFNFWIVYSNWHFLCEMKYNCDWLCETKSLGSNQSQDFDIFTYVSSNDLEAMNGATFNVVEVSMY